MNTLLDIQLNILDGKTMMIKTNNSR